MDALQPYLTVPERSLRRYSDSGESSGSSIGSLYDTYPGLRRSSSTPSLVRLNDPQITEMSQNIGGLSLEDNQPLDFRGRTHPEQSFVTASSLYGDNTVLSISAPDDLLWSPVPPGPSSPTSLTSSRSPVDGRAGNDNGNLVRRRSARSVQASLNRRKSPGPGKFVCDICRDDFTTKHRLKGE